MPEFPPRDEPVRRSLYNPARDKADTTRASERHVDGWPFPLNSYDLRLLQALRIDAEVTT